MAKKPAPRAKPTRAMPEPPTGQPKPAGYTYPEPTGGPINNGLGATSHNGSNYPQPNNANNPDPASAAPPAPVPGPEAYRPSLAGNALSPSMSNPGVDVDADDPPDYPQH